MIQRSKSIMTSLNDDVGECQNSHRHFLTSALDSIPRFPREGTQTGSQHTAAETSPSATKSKVQTSPTSSQLPFFIVIGCLFFGTFLVALDTTIIGTAIPAITTEFRSLNDIGWYGSGYLLTLTALQPTFGRLYAMWNTKIIYLVCVLVFEGRANGPA